MTESALAWIAAGKYQCKSTLARSAQWLDVECDGLVGLAQMSGHWPARSDPTNNQLAMAGGTKVRRPGRVDSMLPCVQQQPNLAFR
ncbi:hypothetical protein OKW39_003620 [Paraburkholderia sp. MM6662-R1]